MARGSRENKLWKPGFSCYLVAAKHGGSIMKLKTLLAAAALALAPGLAFAMGGCGSMQQSASACSDGQVWDAALQSCITPPSS